MSVFLLNATSLAKPNAIQLLETELLQMQCDTAVITESWFTKHHQDAMLMIQGYSLYRCDRSFGKGGGVCAYVRNHITCYRQDLPQAALPVFRLLTGRFWGFSPRRGDTLHRSRSN